MGQNVVAAVDVTKPELNPQGSDVFLIFKKNPILPNPWGWRSNEAAGAQNYLLWR